MIVDEGRPAADVVFRFRHERSAPKAVRALIRPMFPVTDPLGVDVTLVASELVTDVIVTTLGGGEVRAWLDGPNVRLEVWRSEGDLPGEPAAAAESKGVEIVAALAVRWGVEPMPAGGGVVWAEFRR